ncbi:hypothetical protein [Sphingomonas sp. LT1P40]|uniref:hypothetical protein n=1 Tax=Alteristakelama amylovorans TaxID=3096166 RepID=UPI002FC5A4AF
MFRVSLLLPFVALATACAGPERVAAPAPAPPLPMAIAPAPVPPDRAASGLTIPARLADGSYATPNRAISAAGALWHLRAAFNVAALNCPDGSLAPAYNRVLAVHRKALTTAHRALIAEHGDNAAFDPAMTRLYNYFAQPPVLARFCATTAPLLHAAAALPPGEFAAFSTMALAQVDRPFADFYARYDSYRAELAAWRSGVPVAPRLAYDSSIFVTAATVTGGRTALAAR